MLAEIDIQIDRENYGDWIKIFIPYASDEQMFGILQNEQGATVKKLKLTEGYNSIDISNLNCAFIHLKIETPYETIFKKLKLKL